MSLIGPGELSLGTYLRSLRKRRGLSQLALARALGLIGNGHISRIESGRAIPSGDLLEQLAALYGVERQVLLSAAETEQRAGNQSWVDRLRTDSEQLQERLAQSTQEINEALGTHHNHLSGLIRASGLNALWGLQQKLRHESRSQEVWIASPDLSLDTNNRDVHDAVQANLRRGVKYRYLVPNTPKLERLARRLIRESPKGAALEICMAPPEHLSFLVETVFYDPRDKNRRLGLLVAPMQRPDFDMLLDKTLVDRFLKTYRREWDAGEALRS